MINVLGEEGDVLIVNHPKKSKNFILSSHVVFKLLKISVLSTISFENVPNI